MFEECGIVMEKVVNDVSIPIDVAHYILMALSVREEAGHEFAVRHPAASWLCTLLVSFSGTFLTNFLLGETLLKPLTSRFDMILFTTIWYFISIPDTFSTVCSYGPVKNVISVMKEIQRNHKIMLGVGEGTARFVDHTLLQVLVGCTKGNGSGIVKIVQQFVYGKWAPTENEVLKPSTTTKATILAAIVYASPNISRGIAYLCGVCVLVGSKVMSLTGLHESPMDPAYNALCFVLFHLPRALESQVLGVAPLPESVKSSEVGEGNTENDKLCEAEAVATSENGEEWRKTVTEFLISITDIGRTNGENIDRLHGVVGKLDTYRSEISSLQTEIIEELRKMREVLTNPSARNHNPCPDSTVILTSVPDTME